MIRERCNELCFIKIACVNAKTDTECINLLYHIVAINHQREQCRW